MVREVAWKDGYEVDNPAVDREHRELIRLVNLLPHHVLFLLLFCGRQVFTNSPFVAPA